MFIIVENFRKFGKTILKMLENVENVGTKINFFDANNFIFR